jgi:predicted nucleotidyltransferase
MNLVDLHITTIAALCAQHGVKNLYAFGSVLTPAFNNESDVDLVVDFLTADPSQYAENYFSLKTALQNTLNRQVDLLEQQSIRNLYLKKHIEDQRKLVYAN